MSAEMPRVLFVDDDGDTRFTLRGLLKLHGLAMMEAASGEEGIRMLREDDPDAVLLDLHMPEMDGMQTMLEMKKIAPDVPIIIMTGNSDIGRAVEAIKKGAYDYTVKPPDIDRLVVTIRKGIEKAELERKFHQVDSAMDTSLEFMLGESKAIRRVIRHIRQVAASDLSIVLQGETGTGKSYIARIIHNMSLRASRPFVYVDLGAIPETLAESALFGHERGSFTGAEQSRKGFFEHANTGTLFIDELTNASPAIQSKLLSSVEERQIFPVGNPKPVEIDIRIIAAANEDLAQCVEEGKFRSDLFYRLGEFIFALPPLRERREDIPVLAVRFAEEAGRDMNKWFRGVTDESIRILLGYRWPGNIRELKNVMRRAVVIADDGIILPQHLVFMGDNGSSGANALTSESLKQITKKAESRAIRQVLQATRGNRKKAAEILDISYRGLMGKVKEYGIE